MEAFGDDPSAVMAFPIGDVFVFDPKVWEELRRAMVDQDEVLLNSAWTMARPFAS